MTSHDPFSAPLAAEPPVVIRDIPTPAGLAEPPAGVSVCHVLFRSLTIDMPDGPVTNEVHAAIVSPEGASGPLPGILMLHGGGGRCELDRAILWAQRGYVSVAPDLPSIANPETVASTGEWTKHPYGDGRMTADPDASHSTLFQGIVAGIEAFKLLQSQPNVDSAKLGIIGISWGGYMTTMLSGLLGDQVKAAVSVFGCGFYEDTIFAGEYAKMPADQYARWMEYLDAGRRASGIRAAFFFAAASNDTFFWPLAIARTYHEIPGVKNVVFAPNCDHDLGFEGGGEMNPIQAKDWFDYYLKGEGEPYPVVDATCDADGAVAISVSGSRPVASVALYYTTSDTEWKLKVWEKLDATVVGEGAYAAQLPADATGGEKTYWFAFATDDRPVSVSSLVKSAREGA